MKDKEARRDILDVLQELRDHKRKGALADVVIRDCPKCKHPVLAKGTRKAYTENGSTFYISDYDWSPDKGVSYQCLTCSCKFACSKEWVCREVK